MNTNTAIVIVGGAAVIIGLYLYFRYTAANTPGIGVTYQHGGLSVSGTL